MPLKRNPPPHSRRADFSVENRSERQRPRCAEVNLRTMSKRRGSTPLPHYLIHAHPRPSHATIGHDPVITCKRKHHPSRECMAIDGCYGGYCNKIDEWWNATNQSSHVLGYVRRRANNGFAVSIEVWSVHHRTISITMHTFEEGHASLDCLVVKAIAEES
jgi:hypothetical protein